MKLKRVNFRGDIRFPDGKWRSHVVATKAEGREIDIWCDGAWVWVELPGSVENPERLVAGVPAAHVDAIVPDDVDEVRRRRTRPVGLESAAPPKPAKQAAAG